MESQIENSMESSAPVTFESKIGKSQPNRKGLVGIMIFLIICLLGGLTYYILKDNGIDLLSNITGAKDTQDTALDTNTNTKDGTVCPECTVSVVNKGWGLFTVPAYNLSVEVPTYTLTQKLATEDVPSVWRAWYNNSTELVSYLDNYIGTMNVLFYPTWIPEDLGCGQGCVNEHTIYVNIHTNKDAQDLTAAISSYRTKWENIVDDFFDITATDLNGETVSKWGTSVWSFKYELPDASWRGYLVVNKDYIYNVEYYLSDTPKASYDIALKVLDSLKFE